MKQASHCQISLQNSFDHRKNVLLFSFFHLSLDVVPLIRITLSTQDCPWATPATLCDDVNHPTIPGPIWQLPTLEAFTNTEVNETPVLANAPLCSGLKLLGDPQEALKDWLHYGCQHAATYTSWMKWCSHLLPGISCCHATWRWCILQRCFMLCAQCLRLQ